MKSPTSLLLATLLGCVAPQPPQVTNHYLRLYAATAVSAADRTVSAKRTPAGGPARTRAPCVHAPHPNRQRTAT
jgi:hypothetical protein